MEIRSMDRMSYVLEMLWVDFNVIHHCWLWLSNNRYNTKQYALSSAAKLVRLFLDFSLAELFVFPLAWKGTPGLKCFLLGNEFGLAHNGFVSSRDACGNAVYWTWVGFECCSLPRAKLSSPCLDNLIFSIGGVGGEDSPFPGIALRAWRSTIYDLLDHRLYREPFQLFNHGSPCLHKVIAIFWPHRVQRRNLA
jgi:hypothetical protein